MLASALSMMGASDVTTTSCFTEPIVSVKFNVTVVATFNMTPVCFNCWKPSCSTVTLYVPTGRFVNA